MTSINLSKYMSLGTSKLPYIFLLALFLASSVVCAETYKEKKERFLRSAAIANGYSDLATSKPEYDDLKAELGKFLFEEKLISYNGEIACVDCHLSEFSGGDGIPVSIGLNGTGKGLERIKSGGKVIPRNSLTLWGRGDSDFNAFFWDGRVENLDNKISSQFAQDAPSDHLLEVAVHLPVLELGEMLIEDDFIRSQRTESQESAKAVLQRLAANFEKAFPDKASELKNAYGFENDKPLEFILIAKAISQFIKRDFAVEAHAFNDFVFNNASISEDEIDGGILFYGKGKCAACHSGRHFSDFNYHVVAVGQMAQGKNGFGVDYGRFNVTHDPKDLYAFRTAPLVDVTDTFPYGHSGSAMELEAIITDHFDPLKKLANEKYNAQQRINFNKVIKASGRTLIDVPHLSDQELSKIVKFLGLLRVE